MCVRIKKTCSQAVIQTLSGNFSQRRLWGSKSAAAESVTFALVLTHKPVTEMALIWDHLGSSPVGRYTCVKYM